MVFCTIASLSTQTHGWRGSFDIVDVTGRGGGVLPQKIFGLNGFKSCNSRQKKKMPFKVIKQGLGSWILFMIWIREI